MAARQPLLHDLAVALRTPTVVLSGVDGQIRDTGTQGVLFADVRVLSRAVLTVAGDEPEPIGHDAIDAATERFTALLRGPWDVGADPTAWLHRHRTVTPDGVSETFEVVSRSERPVQCQLTLSLAADLAPIEVIKSGNRHDPRAPRIEEDGLVWETNGVLIRLAAPDGEFELLSDSTAAVRWTVDLAGPATQRCDWTLTVQDSGSVVHPARQMLPQPNKVRAGDWRLADLVRRSVDDLNGLLARHGDDTFAAAGAPWYLTLFGRDSIWAARLLLPLGVELAAGTLRTLARLQGTKLDPETGEAPGKIPHELRRSAFEPGTATSLPPLYYGTIDATPLWICLLHDAWRWGMPDSEVAALLPNLLAALDWIRGHSDIDGDGFAEYIDESGRGLANQGWKDSWDAIRFSDGDRADPPVALVEVQGYLHEAACRGADLLAAFGRDGADDWRRFAAELTEKFRAEFWVSDQAGPYPALALDGGKKPVDALTSNIGHLLGTGLLTETESQQVGRRLLGSDMAGGFGLRTMSDAAGGYSPLSYHCGSVWPHDTAIAILGLTRSGQRDRAAELGRQILHAGAGFGWRLPELFSGYGIQDTGTPIPYPASCRPQAWSAAAAIAVLQAFLGLEVDVPARQIVIRPPKPSPVGALEVEGLVVADARLDIAIDAEGNVRHVQAPEGYRVITGSSVF
ncbi:amylo-alpha-1,6-glucosidase [Saccharopolyspora sp. K220]|uniref:amylo-alpha-1,6-glucosidase n=1 Tax=Saccharopolyspora soli TaxID=2926618 RepID=UPI001F59EF0A|nr:glycogen debranching N-terminal domain-containing protein [Saccharopolyspora soli]MCI2420654.1 amylo-alpha-1,6-glucosidase [Saccharopolyspora soli]